MPYITKLAPGQESLEALRSLYIKTERKIINEITRKRNLELVDYAEVAALERVQAILREMTDKTDEYIPQVIEKYFYDESTMPGASKGYANAMALTSTQTNISQILINNLLAQIDEAAGVAYNSASKFLEIGRLEADAFRNLTLEAAAEREASGRGWQTIQNQLAAELNAKGLTSFTDAAGREWSLSNYCTMATRTTGRQAQVAAALTADDHDLWQISKIGSTCPVCSVYEGRVYSKSGTNPDYPPLAMAFGKIDPAGSDDLSNTYLNIHPNCLHSLVKYTTIGKSEEQIERDKKFSSFEERPDTVDYRSKRQVKAYREKEATRAKYRQDLKQFEKYKAALGKEMPKNFETFEKHKKLDDDLYKSWEQGFRVMNRNASELLKEAQKGDIIDIDKILIDKNADVVSAEDSISLKNLFNTISFDESFDELSLPIQKSLAHGLSYVKDSLGEKYLPKSIFVDDLGDDYAKVSLLSRKATFNKDLSEADAILSAVHESVHIADNLKGDIADDVLKEAFRKLGVRKIKDKENVLVKTMGLNRYYMYRNDPSEQLAWCFEKSLQSGSTDFAKKVQSIFLRRCGE